MKAVIMAGGEGTRLRPQTSNLPKPMLPLVTGWLIMTGGSLSAAVCTATV